MRLIYRHITETHTHTHINGQTDSQGGRHTHRDTHTLNKQHILICLIDLKTKKKPSNDKKQKQFTMRTNEILRMFHLENLFR